MNDADRIPVLQFANTLARGGAEEHILTLLRGLDRSYFRLHLICPPEVAATLRSDLPADVELIPLCLRKPTDLAAAVRFASILRRRRIGILHSHQFYASLFASPIGALCRVPLIVETPHVREVWRRGWLKSRYIVDRLAGGCVDYYIAVSRANARYLTQQKRLPERKVVVIHNGCNLDRFRPDHPAPSGFTRQLGFDSGDPILLVVARLEPQKGHRVVLEALAEVRREFPRTRLVCVGDGALRRDLERRTVELGQQDSVRFVGQQSNVEDWLALADLTVLPSFFEGLPLVAIESLASGRPVVATAVDGTPEVVIHEKTGLIVPPGDVSGLAKAICRLLRDPEQRRSLGRTGRQWVGERFSDRDQICRTQDFYLTAWKKTPRMTVSAFANPDARKAAAPTCNA